MPPPISHALLLALLRWVRLVGAGIYNPFPHLSWPPPRADEALSTLLPLVPGCRYFRFQPVHERCAMELDDVDPAHWAALQVRGGEGGGGEGEGEQGGMA